MIPRGLKTRIHRKNWPLFDSLPIDHPAIQTLIRHAECRRDCVARELGNNQLDQRWFSPSLQREYLFSNLAYQHLSFSLILSGWIHHLPQLSDDERGVLEGIAPLRQLLDECETAARVACNSRMLLLLEQVREFLDCWERSVWLRIKENGLTTSFAAPLISLPNPSLPPSIGT